MKKINLVISALLSFTLLSNAQVSFEADNYPQVGDSFPIITFMPNFTGDSIFISTFGDDEMTFDNVSMFGNHLIDTLSFLNPADYDSNGNFPTATHMVKHGLQRIFVAKTDNEIQQLGFSGDLFNTGMELQIPTSNPLKIMEFPTTIETNFTSETNIEYALPIEALQTVLAENYETIAKNVDSVKINLNNREVHNVTDIQTVNINLNIADPENLSCLKETIESYRTIDLFVHFYIFGFGVWGSISDIPNVSNLIPIEFPIVDTTYSIKWLTPEYKTPLVEATSNQDFSIVKSLSFHYNGAQTFLSKTTPLRPIEVYPNPAINQVKVSEIPQSGHSMIIINNQGKIEKRFSINGKFINFTCDNLASGWYILQILDKQAKPIAQQKLIIQ